MVLITAIFILLLFGNWFINETLIFLPVDFFTTLTSSGWWLLAILCLVFVGWCMGED